MYGKEEHREGHVKPITPKKRRARRRRKRRRRRKHRADALLSRITQAQEIETRVSSGDARSVLDLT